MNSTEKRWGGASKVYTFRDESYNRLVDPKKTDKFTRKTDAFHVAAAIGIRLNKTAIIEERDHRVELTNIYSIDPDDVLWTVISAMYPDDSESERFEKLKSFADFGIEMLEKEFSTFGNLQSSIESILAE